MMFQPAPISSTFMSRSIVVRFDARVSRHGELAGSSRCHVGPWSNTATVTVVASSVIEADSRKCGVPASPSSRKSPSRYAAFASPRSPNATSFPSLCFATGRRDYAMRRHGTPCA